MTAVQSVAVQFVKNVAMHTFWLIVFVGVLVASQVSTGTFPDAWYNLFAH